ncbi:autotransporter secretion outer membrane protein TamA [Rhodobacter sp. JA431]|uniref:autotransporter assembly complex protein TamA n=1 Tax=Rhodobacter sp. JA431 TaxID=570013 RepID=UPI000BD1EF6C|nr:autotransporter assembly complex family protein [Rhodobacter sp. JA431]SOC07995.1 autotransporter secretion outer membrane protein TamA [Rhodobacter sp. JA431]
MTRYRFAAALAFGMSLAAPVAAETAFQLEASGADKALTSALEAASLTRSAATSSESNAQDIFASARADYARLVGALYDAGYYGGRVSIRIDGREAAQIAPMDAPAQISAVTIHVEPGPVFRFSKAAIAPVTEKTELPEGYRVPEVASSSVIVDAAQAGVSGWRDFGHAKARVSDQSIVADHRANTIAADITLAPGPLTTFGQMQAQGQKRLRAKRLYAIAGFPSGKRFSPEELETVRNRLRRTGIFSSVTLTEADTLRDGNLLDADLTVVEAKPRRIGVGAELSSTDGATLSGYWLHRNLFGGGERLRFDAEVSGIGGSTGGADYSLAARIDRPATFTPDTAAYLTTELSKSDEEDYTQRGFGLGFGLSHIFNPRLTGEAGIGYEWSQITDATGRTIYRAVTLPLALTWDNRDNSSDATKGYYGRLDLMPFYGLSNTGSGARLAGDFRAYRAFGERVVLAGRAQLGGVFGSDLAETPRDYLFYSGGGGTVRGQPYQSLGVSVLDGGTLKTGGDRFLGFSGEVRVGVTKSIGVVAFYDAGFVGAGGFSDTEGDWQSGAGLGLRYKTPIGPIRLDVAAPVSGDTGDGPQIYLGIGQTF